jgi:hypothetical protein
MLLIQYSPTEVRELNLNTFRLALKNIEDDEAGIVQPTTHNHNPVVTVSGVQLARVIEILDPYTITFENGQYAVNLVGANSNVADKTNVNNVSVRSANSAGLIQTREIEYASFGGGVWIDSINGIENTAYPAGTETQPVKDWEYAKFIADLRGFTKIFVKGNFTIDDDDDISDYTFIGSGASLNTPRTTITLTSGCINNNTIFENAMITGVQGGEAIYKNCVIGSLSNTHCQFDNCGLIGPIALVNSGWTASHFTSLNNCYTKGEWFVVDYNGSPIHQVYSNFSGRIKIINCTDASADITIRLNAGTIWLDSSCTAGHFILRGVGNFVNDSVGPTHDVAGFTEATLPQHASYDGSVCIDVVNGEAGTLFPIGTQKRPVNNLSDAQAIAEEQGFSSLLVIGELTLHSDDDVSDYDIIGEGATLNRQETAIVMETGCITANTNFEKLYISGRQGGECTFENCVEGSITNSHCKHIESTLSGTLQYATGSWTNTHKSVFDFCDTANDWWVLDYNGAGMQVTMNNMTGRIKIINCTNAAALADIRMSNGKIWIDSSCTAGTIKIRGPVYIDNQTGGTIVDDDTIAQTVWNTSTNAEKLAEYPNSFANYFTKKMLTVAKFLGLK